MGGLGVTAQAAEVHDPVEPCLGGRPAEGGGQAEVGLPEPAALGHGVDEVVGGPDPGQRLGGGGLVAHVHGHRPGPPGGVGARAGEASTS